LRLIGLSPPATNSYRYRTNSRNEALRYDTMKRKKWSPTSRLVILLKAALLLRVIVHGQTRAEDISHIYTKDEVDEMPGTRRRCMEARTVIQTSLPHDFCLGWEGAPMTNTSRGSGDTCGNPRHRRWSTNAAEERTHRAVLPVNNGEKAAACLHHGARDLKMEEEVIYDSMLADKRTMMAAMYHEKEHFGDGVSLMRRAIEIPGYDPDRPPGYRTAATRSLQSWSQSMARAGAVGRAQHTTDEVHRCEDMQDEEQLPAEGQEVHSQAASSQGRNEGQRGGREQEEQPSGRALKTIPRNDDNNKKGKKGNRKRRQKTDAPKSTCGPPKINATRRAQISQIAKKVTEETKTNMKKEKAYKKFVAKFIQKTRKRAQGVRYEPDDDQFGDAAALLQTLTRQVAGGGLEEDIQGDIADGNIVDLDYKEDRG
jgi:hypothetical protein